jgi:hypothetical protein
MLVKLTVRSRSGAIIRVGVAVGVVLGRQWARNWGTIRLFQGKTPSTVTLFLPFFLYDRLGHDGPLLGRASGVKSLAYPPIL